MEWHPALGSDASQESFPLATELGEASVKVTVGNFTADCWLLSTRADRVIALLPSATPAGDGTVTLTRGPLRATTKIHVIPVALGLLVRNQSELGPAFAYHDKQNPITPVRFGSVRRERHASGYRTRSGERR